MLFKICVLLQLFTMQPLQNIWSLQSQVERYYPLKKLYKYFYIYRCVKRDLCYLRYKYNINMAKQKYQKNLKNSAFKKIQLKPSLQNTVSSTSYTLISKKELRTVLSKKIRKERFSKTYQVPKRPDQQTPKGQVEWQNVLPLLTRDSLNCPICLDYCIYPVLTQCGHYYCLQCFENAHKRSQFCCVCRGSISATEYQPSVQLQKLFDKFIEQNFDWSQSVLYYARVQEINKKQQKRKIPDQLQVGCKIDYKHCKNWVEAQITSINQEQLQIQYVSSFTNLVERTFIHKSSRLLAAYKSYSLSKELRYQAQVQIVYRIQRQIRRTLRRPIRYSQTLNIVTSTENNDQAPQRNQEEADRNNWQNLFQTPERTSVQWFTEDVEVVDRNWGVLLQHQPEDNDLIVGF